MKNIMEIKVKDYDISLKYLYLWRKEAVEYYEHESVLCISKSKTVNYIHFLRMKFGSTKTKS